MLRYLGQHPDICMPQQREPLFFGQDLSSHEKRTKTVEEYLSFFAGACDERIVGEKSVWYLYSKTAADEIKAFDPRAKIMIMLRNPVDMVHSLHQQFLATQNETITSFDEALALVEERAAGRALPREAHFPEGLRYTQVPLYFEQVERYFRAFGRDRVKVFLFEDFSQAVQKIYAEALAFLDVDLSFQPEFVIYNKKKKPRYQWLDDLSSSLSSPLMPLPRPVQDVARWRLHALNKRFNRVSDKRAPMSPQTRVQLIELFRPDVERLSALLDRDLTSWSKI